MKFYRDRTGDCVISGPAEPTVQERRRSRGAHRWFVYATFTVTRGGDEYTYTEKDEYEGIRDTREDAIRWFHMNHSPSGVEPIDEATYRILRAKYRSPEAKLGMQETPARCSSGSLGR